MCTAPSKYRAPRKRTRACAHMHKSGLAKFMPVSCSSVGIRACTTPRLICNAKRERRTKLRRDRFCDFKII